MQFIDKNGQHWTDVVRCATCGFQSDDLTLFRCPEDGSVLGEVSIPLAVLRAFLAPSVNEK